MAEIIERLRSAKDLPSMPQVAVEVLELTRQGSASVAEIAAVVERDPALAVKLLKAANSSLFGMSRKVSSIQQATVALGLRTVKILALTFSLVEAMGDGTKRGFDYRGYWRRSLTTAAAARLLAARCPGGDPDESFVAALLCDVGILAAYGHATDMYLPVTDAYGTLDEPIQDIERRFLSTTHAEIGFELLSMWGLPESICNSVLRHHEPLSSVRDEGVGRDILARVIQAGAMISDLFCSDVNAAELESLKKQIVEGVPIDAAGLEGVLHELDGRVRETVRLFAAPAGPTRSYQQIQSDAVARLAELSLVAEVERAQAAEREEAVREEVAQLSDQNRELSEQVLTDGLTGVGNRRALERRLVAACEEAIERRTSMGLIILDIDHFKQVNDTYGHQIGDEVLQAVGDCLKRVSNQTQFTARYGGEEFAILVSGSTARELRDLAEELRIAVENIRIPCGRKKVRVTTSVGATHFQPGDPELGPRQLIDFCDRCLYHAKESGRNRVVFGNGSRASRGYAAVP